METGGGFSMEPCEYFPVSTGTGGSPGIPLVPRKISPPGYPANAETGALQSQLASISQALINKTPITMNQLLSLRHHEQVDVPIRDLIHTLCKELQQASLLAKKVGKLDPKLQVFYPQSFEHCGDSNTQAVYNTSMAMGRQSYSTLASDKVRSTLSLLLKSFNLPALVPNANTGCY